MIYFDSHIKTVTRLNFIDINIPGNTAQLKAYYKIRKFIFCDEQHLFQENDFDKNDHSAIPIIAINHYLGSPDEVVGVVRIYEENKREWFGGRLGVIKEYRSFSNYICPNLFKDLDVSAVYHKSVAAGLIYRAVSLANYLGCDKFSAHVQAQNVKLFERLRWNVIEGMNIHGMKHYLMEADLTAYPATPVYTNTPIKTNKIVSELQNIA